MSSLTGVETHEDLEALPPFLGVDFFGIVRARAPGQGGLSFAGGNDPLGFFSSHTQLTLNTRFVSLRG